MPRQTLIAFSRQFVIAAAAASFLVVMAPPLLVPANAHEFSAKTVRVSHPWLRATPPGAKVGAAYLEISASAEGGDKLIGASAEGIAGRVEIHTHEHAGDVMKMRQLDALPIEAGKSVVFAPAGHHLMLLDLVRPLEEGDLIALTLNFEKAGAIAIEASVEPIGAKGPHGMDHQPGHEHDGHDMKQDHKH